MEKKFILIVLSFFIFSCVEQTIHSFDKTGIEIVRGKINMMPSGNILVRAFYDGRPSEKVDKNFKNTIKLTSIYPITINGIHNNLVSEEFSSVGYSVKEITLFKSGKISRKDSLIQMKLDELASVEINLKRYPEDFFNNVYNYLVDFEENYRNDDNDHIFIFYLDKNIEYSIDYINQLKTIIDNNHNWWFGIFYNHIPKVDIKLFYDSVYERTLFFQPSSKSDIENKLIVEQIDLLESSLYNLGFTFEDYFNPLIQNIDITVEGMIKGENLKDTYQLKINEVALKKYFLDKLFTSLQQVYGLTNYEYILKTLMEKYTISNYPEIYKKAEEYVNYWLQNILQFDEDIEKYNTGLDIIKIVDSNWSINNKNYKNHKINLLIDYSLFQKKENFPFNQRIEYYEIILNLVHKNNNVRFDYLECLGDAAKSDIISIKNYHNALKIKNNLTLENKLKSKLFNFIKTNYTSQNYDLVCKTAKDYGNYLEKDFAMNYYWGNSLKNTSYYNEAYKKYDWLLSNWEKNNFVTWDDILQETLQVATYDFHFNDAYEIFRRLSLKNLLSDKYKVTNVLLYLRGMFLEPFVKFSEYYFHNRENVEIFKKEIDKRNIASYIQSIQLIDKKWKLKILLYGKQKLDFSEIKKDTNTPYYAANSSGNYFIQPINNGYFVLKTTNSYDQFEDAYLSDLQKDFQNEEKWNELYSYIYGKERKELIKLLSIYFGIIDDQSKYIKLFDDFPFIQYVAIQDTNGIIKYNNQFEKNNLIYEEHGWTNSNNAVFIHEQITKTVSGVRYFDVAYPIYNATNWNGIIRIGYSFR